MKRLERSQMKSLKGGLFDAGITCKTKCWKWVGGAGGSMSEGTCTKNTQVVGGVTLESCDCSLAGGTSCNQQLAEP